MLGLPATLLASAPFAVPASSPSVEYTSRLAEVHPGYVVHDGLPIVCMTPLGRSGPLGREVEAPEASLAEAAMVSPPYAGPGRVSDTTAAFYALLRRRDHRAFGRLMRTGRALPARIYGGCGLFLLGHPEAEAFFAELAESPALLPVAGGCVAGDAPVAEQVRPSGEVMRERARLHRSW